MSRKPKHTNKERLEELLAGLLVPNIDLWLYQDPKVLKMLGAMLAMKVCGESQERVDRANHMMAAAIVIPDHLANNLELPAETSIIVTH